MEVSNLANQKNSVSKDEPNTGKMKADVSIAEGVDRILVSNLVILADEIKEITLRTELDALLGLKNKIVESFITRFTLCLGLAS